ncbi:hypothetical protein HN873_013231 [Arachis hypogaea]
MVLYNTAVPSATQQQFPPKNGQLGGILGETPSNMKCSVIYSWNIERVRVLLAGSLASSGNLARTMDLIADINATKLSWSLVMGVVRLYDFPSQWNENEVFSLEMVLQDVKGDRIQATISKPTLETEVILQPIETFAFNPFKFHPFTELESNGASDENLLFDYIGEVVEKEEARGIITCTGHQSKRITLQLEDLEYRLQIIVTDGTRCLKLIVWNKEAEQMVGKSADKVNEIYMWEKTNSYPKHLDNVIDKRFLFKLNITYKNINAIEGVYSVTKLSDEDFLMSSFGCASSSAEASVNFPKMGNTPLCEIEDDNNAHGVVSLSKESAVESNNDSSYQTPTKRSSPDTVDGYIGEAIVFVDAQALANKTFKRNFGKKME